MISEERSDLYRPANQTATSSEYTEKLANYCKAVVGGIKGLLREEAAITQARSRRPQRPLRPVPAASACSLRPAACYRRGANRPTESAGGRPAEADAWPTPTRGRAPSVQAMCGLLMPIFLGFVWAAFLWFFAGILIYTLILLLIVISLLGAFFFMYKAGWFGDLNIDLTTCAADRSTLRHTPCTAPRRHAPCLATAWPSTQHDPAPR